MYVQLCMLEQWWLVDYVFDPNIYVFFLHTDYILRFYNQFTRLTTFPITCSVFLYIVCLWYKLNHPVHHCCIICWVNGTILTILNQQGHIVTDTINNDLMNILKILTCCGLMWQYYYITVVKGTWNWTVCEIYYILVAWFSATTTTTLPICNRFHILASARFL